MRTCEDAESRRDGETEKEPEPLGCVECGWKLVDGNFIMVNGVLFCLACHSARAAEESKN